MIICRNLAFALLLVLAVACRPKTETEISIPEIRDEISFLASDSLKGRYPGTAEEKVLSSYICKKFRQAGLTFPVKNGLQPFEIIRHITAGEGNMLATEDTVFLMQDAFAPMPFSSNDSITNKVVFAGYGFDIQKEGLEWEDYRDLDVANKWVLILKGNPEPGNLRSIFLNYSDDRAKALKAADMGAAGVLFAVGPANDQEDRLLPLKDKKPALPLPVIQIKRSTADYLLTSAGKPTVEQLEQYLDSSHSAYSFELGSIVLTGKTELEPEADEAFNTIAEIRGNDNELKTSYIIIGAHHDHLGMGGPGSSSRKPDTIAVHYGADDNASGVAGVIEIAENMTVRNPGRSMLFASFSGEEMGLLGSRYFADNMPVESSSVSAMINLDMVGRLDENRTLQISGVGTSPVFAGIIDSLNKTYNFNIKSSQEGYGPSDHASFYAKDIPVLYISTGAHPDYHTPGDNAEKINYEGCQEVYAFTADLAEALSNYSEPIPFTEAGPKVKASSTGRYGKITLGIMPDAAYEGTEGLPVLFVTEGRPAAVGGILKGDTIIAIEGKNVGNVYDYMSRLSILKEGQSIVVTVKRDGTKINLFVQL